jgi:hypothetical protein
VLAGVLKSQAQKRGVIVVLVSQAVSYPWLKCAEVIQSDKAFVGYRVGWHSVKFAVFCPVLSVFMDGG